MKLKVVQDKLSVDEAVEALSDEALVCRDLNHTWGPHGVARIDGGYERSLQCRVCTTIRRETLNNWGGLVGGRTYEYPEGYKIEGVGRFTGEYRQRARWMNITRAIAQQEAAQLAAQEAAAAQIEKANARITKPRPKAKKDVVKTTSKKPTPKKQKASV